MKSITRLIKILVICFAFFFVFSIVAKAEENYVATASGNAMTRTSEDGESIITGYCGGEGDGKNISWSFDGNKLTISGSGKMKDYSGSYRVPWYSYRENIKNIVVEEGVTRIGDYAFDGCGYGGGGRPVLSLPNSLLSIGCSSLASYFEQIFIPSSVSQIDDYAFSGCGGLEAINVDKNNAFFKSINGVLFSKDGRELLCYPNAKQDKTYEFPVGVVVVGPNAFDDARNLLDIRFSTTVETIGHNAFSGCSSLQTLDLPDGLLTIGDRAFEHCSKLKELFLPASVKSVGFCSFSGLNLTKIVVPGCNTTFDTWAFSGNKVSTAGPIGGDYDFQFGWIDAIPSNVFDGCNITSVVIPDSITIIEENAFSRCNNLTSVNIPSSVKTIEYDAFGSCKNLYSVTFHEGVEHINDAFRSCDKLEAIVIPSSVQSVSFSDCDLLNTVGPYGGNYDIQICWQDEIPDSAFSDCGNLQEVVIPEGIKRIGEFAFSGCRNLSKVVIPDSVNSIERHAFWACPNLTTAGPVGGDYNYQLGWKKEIPDYVFAYFENENLLSIKIPEGIETIGKYAFYNCQSLNTVELSNSVTKIGEAAFYLCPELKTVYFGENLEYIDQYAFYCGSIETVCIDSTLKEIGYLAFGECRQLKKVSIAGRNTADNGAIIGRSAFSNCKELGSVVLGSGIKEIGPYAFSYCPGLSDITLGNTLQIIEDHAFYKTALYTVIIPNTVETISSGAFAKTNLSSVLFGNHLSTIGSGSFSGTNLTSVLIPDSVISIDGAFSGCSKLYRVSFGNGLVTIGSSTFKNCTSLSTISLPDSVSTIGRDAFYGCNALSTVNLGKGVSEIGSYAFANCTSLASIAIPNSVSNIDSCTFKNCSKLANVTIGTGVKKIGSDAFANCSSLHTINYLGDKLQWGEINISSGAIANTVTIRYARHTDNTLTNGEFKCVLYCEEWVPDQQWAYFSGPPVSRGLVTRETNPLIRDCMEEYCGKHVLATFRFENDEFLLLDMVLVSSTYGIVSDEATDGSSITVNGVDYPLSNDLRYTSAGDHVVLHSLGSTVVGVDLLEKIIGRLSSWDKRTGQFYVDPDGLADPQRYTLSAIASASSSTLLNQYKGQMKDVEYYVDSAGFCYHIALYTRPPQPEFDYNKPLYDTEEEEFLAWYADNWYDAYTGWVKAVQNALTNYSETSEMKREDLIAKKAEEMRLADENSYHDHITFHESYGNEWPNDWKNAAYIAYSTFLLDHSCEEFDFGTTDLSKMFSGATLVNNILQSMQDDSVEYRVGDIKVNLKINQFGGAKLGDISCSKGNGKVRSASIVSTKSECQKVLESFTTELQELGVSSINNIYTSVCKDVFGKTVSQWTSDYIKKTVEPHAEKLLKSGVGDLSKALNSCHNYYKFVNRIARGDLNKIENLIPEMNKLVFKDTSITDKTVRKAMEKVNKARDSLNEATVKYINGELTVNEWTKFFRYIVACPVNVSVLSSSGEQIGYVGEDDVWYTEQISIEERGDGIIIDSYTDDQLSFVITATDYGIFGCSIEEFDQSGKAIGRMNFYDIQLTPNQKFEADMPETLSNGEAPVCITSQGVSYYPDEYISVDEDGSVQIACFVEATDGSTGGIVSGAETYVRGDVVVLIAKPEQGYRFMGWYENDILISTSLVYEFIAKENVSLNAVFSPIPDVSIMVGQNKTQAACMIKNLSADCMLVLAFYDENGRFRGLKTERATNGTTIVEKPEDGYQTSAFLLNDKWSPLTERVTVQGDTQ